MKNGENGMLLMLNGFKGCLLNYAFKYLFKVNNILHTYFINLKPKGKFAWL